MNPKQFEIPVHDMTFAAQAWGDPKCLPVIALHGWLDNSASFYRLAPLLNNVYLVAVDLAGHGRTSHRGNRAPYNIWEDVAEIFAIADYFGWNEFGLLGHSRGGIISTLVAGTYPDRISHLGLIEGILPEPIHAEDTPDQLARSIDWLKNSYKKTNPTVYPDLAAAIAARERGMFPLSNSAAAALTERGIQAVEGGFSWTTDPLLRAPSAVKLLPEQMAAFIGRVKATTRLVLGEDGMPKIFPAYTKVMEKFSQIDTRIIPGGHHLHMEDEVNQVAALLNLLFDKKTN